MKSLVITSDDLRGLLMAMRIDLGDHLSKTRTISVAGELTMIRQFLDRVDHAEELVLSEENETLVWNIAQAAMAAVLIGCASRGLNLPKSAVN